MPEKRKRGVDLGMAITRVGSVQEIEDKITKVLTITEREPSRILNGDIRKSGKDGPNPQVDTVSVGDNVIDPRTHEHYGLE